MSEDVLPHAAFDIVHRKVAVVPIVKPVTPEVGEVGLEIVAVPETSDHVPFPYVGEFAAKVVVVAQTANV
jgi:hypothetical protein